MSVRMENREMDDETEDGSDDRHVPRRARESGGERRSDEASTRVASRRVASTVASSRVAFAADRLDVFFGERRRVTAPIKMRRGEVRPAAHRRTSQKKTKNIRAPLSDLG